MSEAALIQRAEDACRPCGPCDSGLPMGCNCDPEPRAVIAGLLDALASRDARLVAVEALAEKWQHTPDHYCCELCQLRAALRSDPDEASTP